MTYPIIVPLEDFSDDPANNYLQWLFSFSIRDGTTDIFIYIGKENIQVYRNQPLAQVVVIPSSQLPGEVINFRNTVWDKTEKINLSREFVEEVPVPLYFKKDLEEELENIYNLKSINDLSNLSSLRAIRFDEVNLLTGLSKIPEEDGYRIHINYR